MTKSVQKVVELANSGGPRFGVVLEDSLVQAYELLEAYYGSRPDWYSIHDVFKSHVLYQSPSESDVVIEGLRDYGEKAIRDQRNAGLSDRRWPLKRPLFRRLALYLMAVNEPQTADEKIERVLDCEALFDSDLKYELSQVLEVTIEDASEEVRNKALVSIENHVPSEDDMSSGRGCAYVKHNLFV